MSMLAVLVGLVYGNSLQDGFAYDDTVMIEQNVLITRLDYLPKLLLSDYWAGRRAPSETISWGSGLYRPLVLLTYALNYAVGRLDPIGYHLLNVSLHVGVTWLLFLLALQVGLGAESAAVAAAFFAVHPLHTEAVTGIVGRAELLMAGGVLASLWLAGLHYNGLSVAAFAIAILSKEQAVVLPVLAVLYDFCFHSRGGRDVERAARWRDTVSRYAGYLVVLAGYALVRQAALGRVGPPPIPFVDNPLASLDWPLRAANALKVAGQYLWLSVWPMSLSADYSYNAIPISTSIFSREVLAAIAAWGALVATALGLYCKGGRRTAFCVGLTLLTFLPASNLIVPIGTIMGERLFYLPSAGICLLVGVAWDYLTARSGEMGRRDGWLMRGHHVSRFAHSAGLLILVVVCLALSLRTMIRNTDWKDTLSLLRSAAQVSPGSAKVQAGLGTIAQSKGEWERALEFYQAAIGLYPQYPDTEVAFNLNLGTVLMRLGDADRATQAFERAVRLDSRSSVTQYHLGQAYVQQGRFDEAEVAVRSALGFNMEFAAAHNLLSKILIERGHYAEALVEADRALQQEATVEEGHLNRARALEGLGRGEEAAVEYRRARGAFHVPGLM